MLRSIAEGGVSLLKRLSAVSHSGGKVAGLALNGELRGVGKTGGPDCQLESGAAEDAFAGKPRSYGFESNHIGVLNDHP
ncbi:hypothetical protein PS874_02440 [Pseudomonas fluorescens]|jgi:hypothetical protein|nr:hypothetical protein PS874_02440 [Pseudomonas fluorescens]